MYFQRDDRVVGYYLGHKFSGRVTEARFHTVNKNHMIYFVALDIPVTIYGTLREQLTIDADFDGNPVTGYAPSTILSYIYAEPIKLGTLSIAPDSGLFEERE